MERIKIFLIDDHKLFVEGICSLLSDEQRFEIVGCSLTGYELLAVINDVKIDVFMVDINMPDISGVELTRRIKEIIPDAKILALTMFDEFSYVEKMMQNRAMGYVLKSASLQELSTAIETVASGKRFLGTEIQEIVFNKIGGKFSLSEKDAFTNSDQVKLTPRETEILALIAREHTTQQIAEKLFISERTVETHRKNIFSKTKAKSVIGLSKYAIQHGIVTLNEK
ncbi:MAG TPA: response regulator transcription factor [Bacteroidales bacterium]|nr:response regulator transcription factor [Bacteroidales bacterium]